MAGFLAGLGIDAKHPARAAVLPRPEAAIAGDEQAAAGDRQALRVPALVETRHPDQPIRRGEVRHLADRGPAIAGPLPEDGAVDRVAPVRGRRNAARRDDGEGGEDPPGPRLASGKAAGYRRHVAAGGAALSGDDATMADVGGIAGDRLKSLIERIERLEEEKRALGEDIKEVYAEAKGTGFDPKIMRQIIRIRRRDKDDLDEEESLLDVYKRALGMLPDLSPQSEAAE